MKKLPPIALAVLFCCQSEYKEGGVLPVVYPDEGDWVIYEGIVPVQGQEVNMELSLQTGSPGLDAAYRLREWSYERNIYIMGWSGQDRYTTLVGSNPDEVIIKLHNSPVLVFGDEGLKQTKKKRESFNQTTDLFFKTKDNLLVMIDANFREINPQKYSLIRRSKPFTVEGYITFVNDTSEFFEMNTRETWHLSDRGEFAKARESYFKLAKEKFEGIYLRGLAYSVDHVAPDGKNIDVLVFRNIYEMRPGKALKPLTDE